MTRDLPARENALQRSRGRGRARPAGAPVSARTTPHLGQGRSGRAPVRTQTERRGGRCPSRPRTARPAAPSAAPLLTPSALLIDVNGSVRSRRNLFLFVLWKFQVKKKKFPEAAVGSREPWMPVRTPPPAASTLRASPQLAAAGAKNQSEAGAIGRRAGRQRLHLGQGRSLALL